MQINWTTLSWATQPAIGDLILLASFPFRFVAASGPDFVYPASAGIGGLKLRLALQDIGTLDWVWAITCRVVCGSSAIAQTNVSVGLGGDTYYRKK